MQKNTHMDCEVTLMKYLHIYKEMGIAEPDVFNKFIETLTPSIKSFDYFVNWDKVNTNVQEIIIELNILNSLITSTDFKNDFVDLIVNYPNIVKTIPVLLAVRDSHLKILERSYDNEFRYLNFDFRLSDQIDAETAQKYLLFVEKSGLINLFHNRRVKNFVDYVLGVEVGLDSNGRKNRGGSAMEVLVESFVRQSVLNNKDLEYISQARHNSIKQKWNQNVTFDKSARSFDFAVYNNHSKRLFLIETNFYNGGGSKLKSVCGEFKSLFNELRDQNIEMIWITDGKGWHTTKRPLEETFKNNNHIVNIKFIQKGVLDAIFNE